MRASSAARSASRIFSAASCCARFDQISNEWRFRGSRTSFGSQNIGSGTQPSTLRTMAHCWGSTTGTAWGCGCLIGFRGGVLATLVLASASSRQRAVGSRRRSGPQSSGRWKRLMPTIIGHLSCPSNNRWVNFPRAICHLRPGVAPNRPVVSVTGLGQSGDCLSRRRPRIDLRFVSAVVKSAPSGTAGVATGRACPAAARLSSFRRRPPGPLPRRKGRILDAAPR